MTRTEKLLSDALGYDVSLEKRSKPTPRERLERKIAALEKKQLDRISRGRSPGAGAGGFNRDVDNIVHQIRLLRIELDELSDGRKSS
jgi:hypothetical protein